MEPGSPAVLEHDAVVDVGYDTDELGDMETDSDGDILFMDRVEVPDVAVV